MKFAWLLLTLTGLVLLWALGAVLLFYLSDYFHGRRNRDPEHWAENVDISVLLGEQRAKEAGETEA